MERKEIEEKKKMILKLFGEERYVPMKEKELAVFLQVKSQDRSLFRQVLEELLAEGSIQVSKRGRYSKAEAKLYTGTFLSSGRGFGFVEVEGEEEDFYIPENQVRGAFHQDMVQIQVLPGRRGKRTEAVVCRILEHRIKTVVGTYEQSKNFGFVVPDNNRIGSDIFVSKERSKGAVDGHKVVVELTDYGRDGKKPEGKITEILGHCNDPGVDILSVVKGYDLPTAFSEKVLHQAERVAKPVSEADRAGRLDLRQVQMVTIDGEDAKDLDDAVSLSKEGDTYRLGVHIADVTNYVQEYSALDREALKRGTSVYLVDRVIPMLPHSLCNGICSLNEGEDRLALSCLMTINAAGTVTDYRIAETVIHVDRRMSYTAVKNILEGQDRTLLQEYAPLVPMFERMRELSGILRAGRKKRGSIDFDFPETKMVLDEEGRPVEIKPYERNAATDIIEDFMLLANETVAQHFYWLETPFVYRTHEAPDGEKIEKLSAFLRNLGYYIKSGGEQVHPKELQKLLAKAAGTPEEALINRLTLRSMKQARYTPCCTGHFGLAARYYCHFTSPIRRYPDLQIHRIIKEQLRGRLDEARILHYKDILEDVCRQCSLMERRADEAERETEKMKKAEYMESHIGQVYEGVISGITAWGIYVELPNTIEGMIPVAKLAGDYYAYEEASYEMVGQTTGRRFGLGESVTVQVASVDRLQKTIDFLLWEE